MVPGLREKLRVALRSGSPKLFLAITINAFGAGMFFPFALIYYQAVTDLNVATIGIALTSATLTTLAIGPLTGYLVDRFGAVRLVVLSQCIEAIGFVGYLIVSSSVSLFIAALVATAGTRMFYASFSTLIADAVNGAGRDRWYGLVGVSQSVGASLSGIVAAVLIGSVGVNGFRVIILTNACCLVASAILIGTGHRPTRRMPDTKFPASYRQVLRDRAFLLVVVSNGFFILCSMLPGLSFAIFASETLRISLWAIGAIGAVQTIFMIGMQTRISARVSAIRRTRSMLGAGVIWMIACALYAGAAWVPREIVIPYIAIGSFVFTLAHLLYIPASRALAASLAPPEMRGRYVAVFEFSYGVAAASVPAIFGFTFDLAPALPWLVMIAVVVFAMVILSGAERHISSAMNVPVQSTD